MAWFYWELYYNTMTSVHWELYYNKRTLKTCETYSYMKFNKVAFPKERSGINSPERYIQEE